MAACVIRWLLILTESFHCYDLEWSLNFQVSLIRILSSQYLLLLRKAFKNDTLETLILCQIPHHYHCNTSERSSWRCLDLILSVWPLGATLLDSNILHWNILQMSFAPTVSIILLFHYSVWEGFSLITSRYPSSNWLFRTLHSRRRYFLCSSRFINLPPWVLQFASI